LKVNGVFLCSHNLWGISHTFELNRSFEALRIFVFCDAIFEIWSGVTFVVFGEIVGFCLVLEILQCLKISGVLKFTVLQNSMFLKFSSFKILVHFPVLKFSCFKFCYFLQSLNPVTFLQF
jgi:hypothetical protein